MFFLIFGTLKKNKKKPYIKCHGASIKSEKYDNQWPALRTLKAGFYFKFQRNFKRFKEGIEERKMIFGTPTDS